jgi:hypothetical protein
MHAIIFSLALLSAVQSPTTLAAVALFAANVDRDWPADEREPLVTAEALRLMAAATQAIAEEWKVSDGKVRQAIAAFDSARQGLSSEAPDSPRRSPRTGAALDAGRLAIEQLTTALRITDATTKGRLASLKRSVEKFSREPAAPQQADVLEQYFRDAAALLRSMLDAPAPTTPYPLGDSVR